MKQFSVKIFCGIVLILILSSSGCVSPPKDSGLTTSGSTGKFESEPGPEGSPTIPSYVTEVTPFVFPSPTSSQALYPTMPAITPIPEDRSCLINLTSQPYGYNGSAFAFNLKNPPMYINYSVIPTNITGKKVVKSRTLTNVDVVVTYDTFSPSSWLEITVRNKTTGEIYLKDGFGPDYTTYRDRTLKVMKRDDLLIEIKGNQIKATVGLWVKPYGNFDNPGKLTFAECKFWDQPRDIIPVATAKPTPTWAGTA